jgi:hypothetical protein
MPTLLYRAASSELKADGNILTLATALPHPPPARDGARRPLHIFGPCSPALEAEAPAACNEEDQSELDPDRA